MSWTGNVPARAVRQLRIGVIHDHTQDLVAGDAFLPLILAPVVTAAKFSGANQYSYRRRFAPIRMRAPAMFAVPRFVEESAGTTNVFCQDRSPEILPRPETRLDPAIAMRRLTVNARL